LARDPTLLNTGCIIPRVMNVGPFSWNRPASVPQLIYVVFVVADLLLLLVWRTRDPIALTYNPAWRITRSCLTGQDHRTAISNARHLIIRRHMTLTDRKDTRKDRPSPPGRPFRRTPSEERANPVWSTISPYSWNHSEPRSTLTSYFADVSRDLDGIIVSLVFSPMHRCRII